MKKRILPVFLILALLLAALAGCGQNGAKPAAGDGGGEEAEQLLGKGYYVVYDEDDELAGYLHVTGSKITVYDEAANEGDTLRYDFNAKKGLYTLEDGELFGGEEFTVEESRKALVLITEDDDEYTLEEIDKEDMPAAGSAKTPGFPSGGNEMPVEPDSGNSGYMEIPLGCYAVYDGDSLAYYLRVTERTMISYYLDGDVQDEVNYSYDRDGACAIETGGASTFTVQFTYDHGDYYMSGDGATARLQPISESEIPVYSGDSGSVPDTYYIGDNGSIGLYAWLPEAVYGELGTEKLEEGFTAVAQHYDYSAATALIFSTVLSSGGNLQDAVEAARADYSGDYSSDADLLFSYLRDNFLFGSLDSGYISGVYLGDDLEYEVDEDDMDVNGRTWRYCDVYITEGDGGAYISLMFWMEGDDMALVIIGGIAEDTGSGAAGAMMDDVFEIIFSLELTT